MSLRHSPARLASQSHLIRREIHQYANHGESSSARVPIISTMTEMRKWRRAVRDSGAELGVVPTMGALHQGHLDLVKRSLSRHKYTVLTLFVNPMQFAPTEDLSRYPRDLLQDARMLEDLMTDFRSATGVQSHSNQPDKQGLQSPVSSLGPFPHQSLSSNLQQPLPDHKAFLDALPASKDQLVIFNPPVDEMYPLRGELQDLNQHKGLRVEMRGLGDVLEGKSRPQFFTGVATVCTKLFNAVEPDHAYFGQKDIQQALLLQKLVADLLLSHPTPENLHIVPTTRDPATHLALSSRNAYLRPDEYSVAPLLFNALSAASRHWSSRTGRTTGEDIISAATSVILEEQQRLERTGSSVELRLDYVEVFDRDTFDLIRGPIVDDSKLVVAGAVWVGKTRLIDNILLGWTVD